MGCGGQVTKVAGEGVKGRGLGGGRGLIVPTNTISTEYLRLSFIDDAVSTLHNGHSAIF